jgi:hypothetical protein
MDDFLRAHAQRARSDARISNRPSRLLDGEVT